MQPEILPIVFHQLLSRREFTLTQRLALASKTHVKVARKVSKSGQFGFSIWSFRMTQTHDLLNKGRLLFPLVGKGQMLLSFPSVPYPYTVLFGLVLINPKLPKNLFKVNLEWAIATPVVNEFCDHYKCDHSLSAIFSWSHLETPSKFPHIPRVELTPTELELYRSSVYKEGDVRPSGTGYIPLKLFEDMQLHYIHCTHSMTIGTIRDMYRCGLLK